MPGQKVKQNVSKIDLFGNPVGSRTSLAFFRAKALQKCDFNKEVFQKLKFPKNSNIDNILILIYDINGNG